MKFDSNQAWKRAAAGVSANKEALFALAGVFFLLPGLAVSLFFPGPQATGDMAPDKLAELLSEHYASIMPVMIPMILFQAVGTLAMLTLLTDRTRPTVGEALKQGGRGIVPYILSQLILALAIALFGSIIVGLTSLAGAGAVGLIFVAGLALFAAVRTSLTSPVIVIERQTNPIAALKRSWNLTEGNFLRLLAFFALVAIAFLIIMMIAGLIAGIAFSMLFGEHTSMVLMTVISSAISAIMALYFVAIIAAIHTQLAGSPAGGQASALR